MVLGCVREGGAAKIGTRKWLLFVLQVSRSEVADAADRVKVTGSLFNVALCAVAMSS